MSNKTLRVGLSGAEAKRLVIKNGPNKIATTSQWHLAKALIKQFTSPIVLILIVATFISMFSGDYQDGFIILAIIIPSGLLGFWQEHRANNTMQKLLEQLTVNCSVIRDGEETEISVEDLVVGDLVLLSAGNVVPADLQLLDALSLMADESALTGEAFPVEKSIGEEVNFGTTISSGKGLGQVTATGNSTKFGAMVREIGEVNVETSFEKGTRDFGILLSRAMGFLVAIILVASLIQHKPTIDSLLFALALAVGLTPQMLPVIISVSLASGARAMAKQKVVVKRLDAIEDFGSISALCTDKTGTITQGVVKLDGVIDIDGNPSEWLKQLAYLNAYLQQGFKNPLDDAIINDLRSPIALPELVSEIPYDFKRRRLSILTSTGQLITKGAVSEVLEVCDISADELSKANALFERFSNEGNRVLAIATKQISNLSLAIEEKELEFAGFLVFKDPPKADAKSAIAEFRSLGINIYIITGDNPHVALSLANSVGVESVGTLTGDDLNNLTESQIKQRMVTCRVFAAVDPLQKERIIKLLQANGETVGFFGDGINDAAALRAADVGISVDNAVDVAKSAAAIVLLDKDLSVIANGIRLGRKTFVNTIKYIRVTISANFGNVLSMALTSFFLPFLPMLPSQILLLNFLSDFPDLTIAADNVDDEDIAKPRSWDVNYVGKFMITFGLISSLFDLTTFAVLIWGLNSNSSEFRTAWFVESTLTELAAMLILRSTRRFWRSKPSRLLLGSSLILAVVVIALPFTFIGEAVKLVAIPIYLVATLISIALAYVVVNEVAKRWLMGVSEG